MDKEDSSRTCESRFTRFFSSFAFPSTYLVLEVLSSLDNRSGRNVESVSQQGDIVQNSSTKRNVKSRKRRGKRRKRRVSKKNVTHKSIKRVVVVARSLIIYPSFLITKLQGRMFAFFSLTNALEMQSNAKETQLTKVHEPNGLEK